MARRESSVITAKPEESPRASVGQSPSLMMEVVSMVRDPTMSVSQLGKVIRSSRALSDRVLRRANSSTFSIPQRVSSVDQAITLLGFDTLRDMMLRYFVNTAFRRLVHSVVRYESFWNHSISCGVAARILALRFVPASVDAAFVAGLFHDMGFLLLQTEGNPTFGPDIGGKGGLSLDGKTHEELGGWLADQWQLGEEIAEAVRFHHSPGMASLNPALTATVHIADVLCYRLDIGRSPFDSVETFDPAALELLHLEESDLGPNCIEEETKLIRADIEKAPKFDALVEAVKQALVDALGAFPNSERLALTLHYQEGLTMAEIGRVLGTTEERARSLHGDALLALTNVIHDCI